MPRLDAISSQSVTKISGVTSVGLLTHKWTFQLWENALKPVGGKFHLIIKM